ncbi:UbiA family prenyltransferase [Dyadobacter sp. NIV53]|uniref:UbiA family prenyltransferase n=1 Tax=Dyadobacter sp. NIV53 TaxID=2861765 RepID=UPI001C887FFA|nr:UbiA family prenyltransferase [Dyadobacter sp. NIV53]
MGSRIVQFVFFANYFVGLLAIALSVETVFQLELPSNSFAYYLLLFSATVMYYTYAYSGPASTAASANPRTEWYRRHHSFIGISQKFLLAVFLITGTFILFENYKRIFSLGLVYWLMVAAIPIAAVLYYGLLPKSLYRFNLRNTGWLKAFVIGFVWAGCVNILPVTMVKIEHGISVSEPGFMLWLFIKNWMFCTVNAVMFDIKDYDDDANKQLKTFVVRIGLRKTIFFILIPLLLVGLISLLIFTYYKNFGIVPVLINLIPFISLLFVAYSLQRPKKILYYLIVIDGLLLVKAICGITGMLFMKYFSS